MNLYKLIFAKSLYIPNAKKAFDFAYNFFEDEKIILIKKNDFIIFIENCLANNVDSITEFQKILYDQKWISDKKLFVNFFCYFFYENSKRYFYKKLNNNWYFKNPYNSDKQISCDFIKRNYYYEFLDSLKKYNEYNIFLIKFLKILS